MRPSSSGTAATMWLARCCVPDLGPADVCLSHGSRVFENFPLKHGSRV
jgi:hypothetical protein